MRSQRQQVPFYSWSTTGSNGNQVFLQGPLGEIRSLCPRLTLYPSPRPASLLVALRAAFISSA